MQSPPRGRLIAVAGPRHPLGIRVRRITAECIRDCIDDLMKQSPAQQLEEMHATLIRALASLENHDAMETHRLLAVLRGMIEGALAEAQHGRWWR